MFSHGDSYIHTDGGLYSLLYVSLAYMPYGSTSELENKASVIYGHTNAHKKSHNLSITWHN